jgi:hypothetical protein
MASKKGKGIYIPGFGMAYDEFNLFSPEELKKMEEELRQKVKDDPEYFVKKKKTTKKKPTVRKAAKGGMMKKYAKGGNIDDLSPDELMRLFMDLYRKGGGKKPTLAKKNKGGMATKKKKGYAKGGAMKKKGYAMGGSMSSMRKNPTTGMMDYRKGGMFKKTNMIKRPRGK